MISFEIVEHPGFADAVQIYADNEGLRALIEVLEHVRQTGGHIHLRAGADLAERSPYGSPAIAEVIIDCSEFGC